MFVQSNILLPTDFSNYAHHALKYAVALAKRYHAAVHVANVIDPAIAATGSPHGLWITQTDHENLLAAVQRHATERLGHLQHRIENAGVQAQCHLLHGRPAHEIIRVAETHQCSLIVIATHGRTGFDHLVFGSVAEQVVRESPMPVFTIKHPEHECVEDTETGIEVKTILFPTDFSEAAENALPYAVSLAREFKARLVLFHATEMPVVVPDFAPETMAATGEGLEQQALEALEAACKRVSGVEVEIRTSMGVAYKETAAAADAVDADIVVLPTHGHTGIMHTLFGSVAEKIVRTAPCPVLTVRPEAAKEGAQSENAARVMNAPAQE